MLQIPGSLSMRGLISTIFLFTAFPVLAESPLGLKLSVETTPDGARIKRGDRILVGVINDSGGKPILYPVNTPSGKQVVRGYPMESVGPNEKDDHPHHRSFWMTHGEVNGEDFWATTEKKKLGRVVQTSCEVSAVADGTRVAIESTDDWIDRNGNRVLKDARRQTIILQADRLIIDSDITLHASDGDVMFGDTKEGSFAIRIAGSMKSDSQLGGLITNDQGLHGKEAWGKRSSWVDYTGPVFEFDAQASPPDDEVTERATAGITIHCHPSSFNSPCRWHVRTYGLFAANPFGVHHFTGEEPTEGVRLASGESLSLHFRTVIRDGAFDLDQTLLDAEAYASTAPADASLALDE